MLAQTDRPTDQQTNRQTNRQGKNNMSPTTIMVEKNRCKFHGGKNGVGGGGVVGGYNVDVPPPIVGRGVYHKGVVKCGRGYNMGCDNYKMFKKMRGRGNNGE
ncbi:hypothetical protein DPMN_191529 [Dreissena polymorpha]|uniref:Uncharacterized protein n=1 Tax=Dreissena polymorpha TaxID=45954 RepID=A0A9D4BBU2_DREPO|nr:hypothetical protein DPMN_191529 [Dreissena polymorpha]